MIKKQLWIVLIVSLCGFQFGYNTTVISGAILFVSKGFALTSVQESNAVSILLIGALVGAAFAGVLANYLGRRRGMQAAALMLMLGSLAATLPGTFEWFLIGRVIQGLGVGCVSVMAPMYLAEVAPPDKRGAYVSTNQLFLAIGLLMAYVCNFIFAKEENWQTMVGLGFIPAAVQFVCLFFIPETQKLSTKKSGEGSSWTGLFNPLFRKVVIAGVLLTVFQQITGINGVIYFAPIIFETVGFAGAEAAIFASLGLGVINMISATIALKLMDKVGRRPLLMWGTAGMVMALLLIGVALSMENPSVKFVAIFSLMAYVACFSISMGPIPWLVVSEIYPSQIKGQAMSLAILFNWVANYFVAFTFLDLTKWLGFSGTFFLYAAIGVIAIFFVWKKIPETKGQSLEDIEKNIA